LEKIDLEILCKSPLLGVEVKRFLGLNLCSSTVQHRMVISNHGNANAAIQVSFAEAHLVDCKISFSGASLRREEHDSKIIFAGCVSVEEEIVFQLAITFGVVPGIAFQNIEIKSTQLELDADGLGLQPMVHDATLFAVISPASGGAGSASQAALLGATLDSVVAAARLCLNKDPIGFCTGDISGDVKDTVHPCVMAAATAISESPVLTQRISSGFESLSKFIADGCNSDIVQHVFAAYGAFIAKPKKDLFQILEQVCSLANAGAEGKTLFLAGAAAFERTITYHDAHRFQRVCSLVSGAYYYNASGNGMNLRDCLSLLR